MSAPALPYVAVPESFHLPPDMNFGGTSGVAFNSKGHIFVIHRGPKPVMEFDADGNFIRGFGDGHVRPAARPAHRCEDNIWATDVASNLVYKFNPSGRLEMVLGVKGWTGDWHPFGHLRLFQEPNEAVVGPTGDIYVLQGHGKAESLRAQVRQGRQLHQDLGQARARGPANSICRIRWCSTRRACSTSPTATTRRIQVFDADGNYIREFIASRHAVRAVHGRPTSTSGWRTATPASS